MHVYAACTLYFLKACALSSAFQTDVLARKKRFKKVEEQQRNATAQFREAKVVLMQSPEVSSQSSVKAELLRLRNKYVASRSHSVCFRFSLSVSVPAPMYVCLALC